MAKTLHSNTMINYHITSGHFLIRSVRKSIQLGVTVLVLFKASHRHDSVIYVIF